MHLGAFASNLRRRSQESIKYYFFRFCKMYTKSSYCDIHTPIFSLRFIPRYMYKYALVTIGCLLPFNPAYKHMCLEQGQLEFCNFSSCLCLIIIIKRILETSYSMIDKQKTKQKNGQNRKKECRFDI